MPYCACDTPPTMPQRQAPGVSGRSRQSVGWAKGAGAMRGAGFVTGAGAAWGGATGVGAQLERSSMASDPPSPGRTFGRLMAKNGALAIAFIASLWNEGAPKTSRQTEPRR